jgi:hypothetical protein
MPLTNPGVDATTVAVGATPPASPRFTLLERHIIAEWSAAMQQQGVYTEINYGHAYLTEALHVIPREADETWWLIHKTPARTLAVRRWPGLADIVPNILDALVIVQHALNDGHTVATERPV